MTWRGATALAASGDFSSTILKPWMYPSSSRILRDLDLQLRRGHVDSGVLRNDGIAKAREHIGNRVCHSLVFSTR